MERPYGDDWEYVDTHDLRHCTLTDLRELVAHIDELDHQHALASDRWPHGGLSALTDGQRYEIEYFKQLSTIRSAYSCEITWREYLAQLKEDTRP